MKLGDGYQGVCYTTLFTFIRLKYSIIKKKLDGIGVRPTD